MNKILTIAIPAYNAEWCIEKCLSSFIVQEVIDDLEIIVVNDGSTDKTGEIANRFIAEYPNTYLLLNKENGGHGSAINTAIKIAAGKYFKVVDADDWIILENLESFIAQLKKTNVDIVLTHFHTVDVKTGYKQPFKTQGIRLNEIYKVNDFTAKPSDVFECATFHGITYNTIFYKNIGVNLLERVFYEDQEYATLPFAKAETILPLDIFLYQYLIGNENQSVSDANQVKRIKDLEQVILKITKFYNKNKDMIEGKKKYFIYKFCTIVKSYYVVALIKNPDRRSGREDVSRLRQLLAGENNTLVSYTNKEYSILLILHYLYIKSDAFQQMKKSSIFKFAYNIIIKIGSRKRHENS